MKTERWEINMENIEKKKQDQETEDLHRKNLLARMFMDFYLDAIKLELKTVADAKNFIRSWIDSNIEP
jgi:hypothetical protein